MFRVHPIGAAVAVLAPPCVTEIWYGRRSYVRSTQQNRSKHPHQIDKRPPLSSSSSSSSSYSYSSSFLCLFAPSFIPFAESTAFEYLGLPKGRQLCSCFFFVVLFVPCLCLCRADCLVCYHQSPVAVCALFCKTALSWSAPFHRSSQSAARVASLSLQFAAAATGCSGPLSIQPYLSC